MSDAPGSALAIRRADGLLVPVTGNPDDYVSPAADAQYMRGVPRTTREIYAAQWNRFVAWCSDDRLGPPHPREYLPATVGTIREYIHAHWDWKRTLADGTEVFAGLGGQRYAPDTVRLAIKVISVVHQGFGHVPATKHPDVRRQMRGYARDWNAAGYKTAAADAVSPDELLAMVATCDLGTVAGLRDALLLRLAFDTGRRNSELTSITWNGVRWLDDRRMLVTFPFSKTNQDGDDDTVGVEADDVWAPETCPVLLFREFRELSATRGLSVTGNAPVFREVHGGQRRKVGISGAIYDKPMTRGAFQDMVTIRARLAGVDVDPVTGDKRKIVPHSIRHAFALEGDRDGVPIHLLADRGGWSRTSPVILGYMATRKKWGSDNAGVLMRRAEVARRESGES
jgi:integrase